MKIELNNIVPKFLEKEKISGSEIWNHEHVFSKGESVQVVAPSGSGKTSLIHFLYGMRKDYSGNILSGDKKIKGMSAVTLADLRAQHFSIIFQDLRLFYHFSVSDNIEIKRALAPYHEVSKAKEMAERLGIGGKLSQKAGTCSYGEQQRIAIIRALQQPFDFILMDEPFSHLDEVNAGKAMELIEEEAAARGAGIILADLQPISHFNSNKTLHL